MKFSPPYSLVAELNDGGVCSRSFHDPGGLVAGYISEVHEHQGSLYLGSFRSNYIAKLDLSKVGGELSLVPGLICNLRIHVFMILSRMEVVKKRKERFVGIFLKISTF